MLNAISTLSKINPVHFKGLNSNLNSNNTNPIQKYYVTSPIKDTFQPSTIKISKEEMVQSLILGGMKRNDRSSILDILTANDVTTLSKKEETALLKIFQLENSKENSKSGAGANSNNFSTKSLKWVLDFGTDKNNVSPKDRETFFKSVAEIYSFGISKGEISTDIDISAYLAQKGLTMPIYKEDIETAQTLKEISLKEKKPFESPAFTTEEAVNYALLLNKRNPHARRRTNVEKMNLFCYFLYNQKTRKTADEAFNFATLAMDKEDKTKVNDENVEKIISLLEEKHNCAHLTSKEALQFAQFYFDLNEEDKKHADFSLEEFYRLYPAKIGIQGVIEIAKLQIENYSLGTVQKFINLYSEFLKVNDKNNPPIEDLNHKEPLEIDDKTALVTAAAVRSTAYNKLSLNNILSIKHFYSRFGDSVPIEKIVDIVVRNEHMPDSKKVSARELEFIAGMRK